MGLVTEFDSTKFQTLKRNPLACLPKIASLGKALLEKEAKRKKHEEGNMSAFVNWLESGLLNDFDDNTWDFDLAEYLKLKKECDEDLGNLYNLKLSTAEGEKKELTEKVSWSSREVKRLPNEVASLTLAQEKSSGDITYLTEEKDRTEKKVTDTTTVLEEKKTKIEHTVSELKSKMANLEEEKDRAVASQKETADLAFKINK